MNLFPVQKGALPLYGVEHLISHGVVGQAQHDFAVPGQGYINTEEGDAEIVVVGAVQRIDDPGIFTALLAGAGLLRQYAVAGKFLEDDGDDFLSRTAGRLP